MSLAASIIVLMAMLGLLVTGLISLFAPLMLRSLRGVQPRVRAGWIMALLAAPLVLSAGAIGLGLSHCVADHFSPGGEDCTASGSGCALCVFGTHRVGASVWLLALCTLIPLTFRLWRVISGARAAHRASVRLRALARPGPHGSLAIPGSQAFVVGFASPVICLGDDLTARLDARSIQAVAAHEHAHQVHGDTFVRLFGRLLACTHLPHGSRALLAELDLALEQHCDEYASQTVSDPLVVAQALLDTARLQQQSKDPAERGSAPFMLPARIKALCGTHQPPRSVPTVHALMGVLGVTAFAGFVLGHHLHSFIEHMFALVAG